MSQSDHSHAHDHDHGHAHHHDDLDQSITRGFRLAIILTSVTLLAEVFGGLWTNSLALLSDAAHVFMDLFALLLSLTAIYLAKRPASDRRTYGWHRAEVFASLINGGTLIIIAVGILHEAWIRIQSPEAVKSKEMFVIAIIGLVMNLVAANKLHGHAHDDLNVRSAFLHVLGDAIASVAVIVGGLIMLYTEWYMIDALLSGIISLIIGWGSVRLLREAGHILLEGTPVGIDVDIVVEKMRRVEGVNDIHHLHIWAICSHISVLSAHVDLVPEYRLRQGEVIGELERMLEHDFHITQTTLQGECSRCITGPVIQQLRHKPRKNHSHSH
ncbi:MAG: cation transporter [Desulfuromonas sp.]|nr:MAG: cation transporter [Desulfuromonas sp.]